MSTVRAAEPAGPGALARARAWCASARGGAWGGLGALLLGAAGQAFLDAQVAAGLAAAALALAAGLYLAGPGRALLLAAEEPGHAERVERALGAHVAVAAVLAAAAFPLFRGNRFSAQGVALWLGALGVLGAAALPPGARHWLAGRGPGPGGERPAGEGLRLSWAALGLLGASAVGAYLRLYRLAEIPAEVGPDVPHVFANIRTILSGEYPVFFPSHPGREGLFFYLAAPLAHLYGLNHTTIKVASALVGLASIPLLYLLGRELYGRAVGLGAAGMLAISHWHIIASRSGLRAGTLLPPMILAWLWLVRGLRRGRRWEFYLAGAAFGLGMYTYNAYAAVGVAGALLLLGEALAGRGGRLWANRQGLALAAVTALVVLVPLGRYAYEAPQQYVYRAATRVSGLERPLPADLFSVALGNAGRALGMFNVAGDAVFATNVPNLRALGFLTAVLFVLGGARLAWHWKVGYNLAVLGALGAMLLPTALALAFPQEVPNTYRAIGALPPAMLLAAVGLEGLWRAARRALRAEGGDGEGDAKTYVLGGLLALALVGGLAREARTAGVTYLRDYRLAQPRHNYSLSREMARVIDAFAGEAFAVSRPHFYDGNAVRMHLARTDPAAWHDLAAPSPDEPPLDGSLERVLVIVHPDDLATREALRAAYPRGVCVEHRDDDGLVAFLACYGEAQTPR